MGQLDPVRDGNGAGLWAVGGGAFLIVADIDVLFGIVAALIFVLTGLVSTLRFIIDLLRWKRSQKRLDTKGTVIQSRLRSLLVPRDGRKGRSIVTVYIPEIIYEYHIDMASYQSKQLFHGQKFPTTFNFVDDLIEKYPVGKEVTVYYNPEKPEMAVLDRDMVKGIYGYLAMGVFSLLVGFAMLLQVINR